MMRLKTSSFPQLVLGIVIYLCSLQANGFVISDVRVEGLQRVSAGTVFGAIPFNVGDDIDEADLRLIVRALFKTESFDDVQVGRDENILVILVKERPSIDEIEFEGNKAIKSEALLEG